MSILDQIDDTLDNWNGSKDSMRWKPEPDRRITMGIAPAGTDPRDAAAFTTFEVSSLQLDADAVLERAGEVWRQWSAQMAPVFVEFTVQLKASFAGMQSLLAAMQMPLEEGPSFLDARYHQRQRNRRRRR